MSAHPNMTTNTVWTIITNNKTKKHRNNPRVVAVLLDSRQTASKIISPFVLPMQEKDVIIILLKFETSFFK